MLQLGEKTSRSIRTAKPLGMGIAWARRLAV